MQNIQLILRDCNHDLVILNVCLLRIFLLQIGAPGVGTSDSFLLDMSTSAVAVGKIEMQMRKKEPLPSLGWALGTDGKPTTDANEAFYNGSGNVTEFFALCDILFRN